MAEIVNTSCLNQYVRLYLGDFGRFYSDDDINALKDLALFEFSKISEKKLITVELSPEASDSPYFQLPDDLIEIKKVIYNNYFMERLEPGVQYREIVKQCPFGYIQEANKIRLFPWRDECDIVYKSFTGKGFWTLEEVYGILDFDAEQCDVEPDTEPTFGGVWLIKDGEPVRIDYVAKITESELKPHECEILAFNILSRLYLKEETEQGLQVANHYWKLWQTKMMQHFIGNKEKVSHWFRPDPFQ